MQSRNHKLQKFNTEIRKTPNANQPYGTNYMNSRTQT